MSKSTTTREGLENSPSSATVTCSDFYQSQTPPPPCSPSRVSRLVSFSAEPSFPMSPQISSSYNNNSSSSTVFDFVPAAAAGTAKGSSPPPSPSQTPTTTRSRSRNRSRSRISHSGSMVNLMNLVRSTSSMSRSRTEGAASRSVLGLGDVGTEGQSRMSPSVGMEVSMSMSMSMGWFGKACSFIRPWGDGSGHAGDTTGGGEWTVSDSSEENTPASEERKQAFEETHKAVLATLKKILGCAGDVAVDALLISGSVLEYIPVPYLQKVCTMFISIWKGVQQVSMNRLAFLRLTQTCTTILDSIYKEMEDADESTIQDLQGPIQVLERAFEKLLSVVEAQIHTPFLWRYARREDTNKEIAVCNDALLKALALFTNTIQLRTYQAVRANAKVCAESYQHIKMLAESVAYGSPTVTGLNMLAYDARRASAPPEGIPHTPSRDSLGMSASPTIISRSVDSFFRGGTSSSPTPSSPSPSPSPSPSLSPFLTPSTPSPSPSVLAPRVIPVLQQLQSSQNAEDRKADVAELRRSMRAILDMGNDAAVLEFLGIEKADIPEAIKTLQRMGEVDGARVGVVGGSVVRLDSEAGKDTLHQEFIEAGIDALRRMSDAGAMDLPCWTITPFEVQRGPKIGMGFFSEVFQGKWNRRTVAVKVLSEVTPSDLFIREIKVWQSLRHSNVLKLYGASSATGNPPWFFVSPYMKHGNLAEFLRRVSRQDPAELVGLGTIVENLPASKSRGYFGNKGGFRLLKMDDTYRMMQEIAKGMEYLHLKGILHGDLKASNVLVDDHHRCVISDFGQSELKSEVCRITGSSMKNGTLRWKAPELLEGSCMLTPGTDVFAYAIVCIEVLTMGELPWGCISDDEIRYNVLEMDRRPQIPAEFSSPLLHELIGACWHREPFGRMSFNEVVFRLHRLRVIAGDGCDPTVASDDESWLGSPQMSPRSFSRPLSPTPTPYSESVEFFEYGDDYVALPSPLEVDALRFEDRDSKDVWKMPEPVHYSADMKVQSPSKENNSPCTDTTAASSDGDLSRSMVDKGRESPPPTNSRAADARNERRYRYLLEHEFNSSLTLPLWEPSPIQIGDVGYLLKPKGAFVTLFNVMKPAKSKVGHKLSPISDYGSVSKGSMRLQKKSAAQKGLDAFSGFLAFRSRTEGPVSRRQSFRLRTGHKSAHVYTESAEYHYLKKLDAAKAWFRSNVEEILNIYGREHNIQREDVFLVISLLQARDYALFVSHKHPDGYAHFNVNAGARKGQPWGVFSCERNVPSGRNGPSYDEPEQIDHDYASKVSLVNNSMKAVLVGRLRFKPDSTEPTTSK